MANPTTVALAKEVNVAELWLYDCWKVETSQQDESHWFQHAMGHGSCILGYGSDLQWVMDHCLWHIACFSEEVTLAKFSFHAEKWSRVISLLFCFRLPYRNLVAV